MMASSAVDNDRTQILVHLPEYGVVVCRHCAFAIQPRALSSHLLRHQIYRNERRELIHSLSSLNLKEPDEVPVPSAETPAIQCLPVYSGFICNAPGCGHACVSQKRMSQHWSEIHGKPSSQAVDARAANLQTFFRGNKLRYFEVTGSATEQSPREESDADSAQQTPLLAGPDTPNVSHMLNGNSTELSLDSPTKASGVPSTGLDMDSLRYMHQFITNTGMTLSRGTESLEFWTCNTMEEAFSHEYLMYGILSMAAFHLCLNTSDKELADKHERAGIKYQQAGLVGFHAAAQNPQDASPIALVCFSKSLGVQRCAQAMLDSDHPGPMCCIPDRLKESPCAPILEFALLLRVSLDLWLSQRSRLPPDSDPSLPRELLHGIDPLLPDQLITEGQHVYLLHAVIEHLEASMAKDFVGQPYVPKLHDLIEDRDLAKLCSEVLLLNSLEEITVEWVQSTIPHWKIFGTKGTRLVEALQSSVLPAKVAFQRNEESGSPPPFAPMSRFPHIKPEQYEKIISLPLQMVNCMSPEDYLVMPAILPEINALLHSYSRANAYEGVAAIWDGVETWICAMSGRFANLLEERCAPALIVFAFWCALLKKNEGYWFVTGQAERLVGIVKDNIPESTHEILNDLWW